MHTPTYDLYLKLAHDTASGLYVDGHAHGGSSVRVAFWRSYAGQDVRHPKNSYAEAAAAAGRAYHKINPNVPVYVGHMGDIVSGVNAHKGRNINKC